MTADEKIKKAKAVKPCSGCGCLTHLRDKHGSPHCDIFPCNLTEDKGYDKTDRQAGDIQCKIDEMYSIDKWMRFAMGILHEG